jgi:hypothetical protein
MTVWLVKTLGKKTMCLRILGMAEFNESIISFCLAGRERVFEVAPEGYSPARSKFKTVETVA